MTEIHSQVVGAFRGFNREAVFRLVNGQTWQQRRYKYSYHYKYRPHVRIYKDGGSWFADFDCMDELIEVVRVRMLEEGTIVSDFKGFSGNARFEVQSGRAWEQAEYKYSYHYAYRPSAVVVQGIGGSVLHVEGMADSVRVRPA